MMRPLTLLIAEDDKDDLEFLKFLFEKHPSFELLRTISNGEEICREFLERGSRPKILVTDHYMPKVTGMDAIKLLASAGTLKDTAVIVLSGAGDEIGADADTIGTKIHFVKKPSNLTELNDLPEKILSLLHYKNVNRI